MALDEFDAEKSLARLRELRTSGKISDAYAETISATITAQSQKISELREIKDGYCSSMIAWRRLAEDGVPLEHSLARRTPETSISLN